MLKLSAAKQVTLGAMCTALTVLCLYASAVLPAVRIACYFLSSVFIYVLCAEHAYFSAILIYLASTGLGFILLPDKINIVPYALLLGHYGIFKTFLDEHISDRLVGSIIKLLYCDAFFVLAVILAIFVFRYDLSSIVLSIPILGCVLVLQVLFVVYDLLYSTCEKIYLTHIRSSVNPHR